LVLLLKREFVLTRGEGAGETAKKYNGTIFSGSSRATKQED
jgi:hypothetical protein